MTTPPPLHIQVLPHDCGSDGRLSQPAFISMFERARWETLFEGIGGDPFAPSELGLVAVRSSLEYYRPAVPGDVLEFSLNLTQSGNSSLTLHQVARSQVNREVVAEGEFALVCVDAQGNPSTLPKAVVELLGTRPSVRSGPTQHVVANGLTTAVDVQGDGRCVLFVHGFPFDRTMWRHQMATTTGWKRLAPDLRGMGLSDVPPPPYSMSDYADDLYGILDVLKVDSCVLCGLSMGGYVAFEFLRRYSERVEALVLVNSKAAADSSEGKAARDRTIELVERDGAAALAERLVPMVLGRSSLETMPRVVDHLRTMIGATPVAGIVGALGAMRDRPDSRDELAAVDVPTLVIAGDEDQLVPVAEARAMADAIPNAGFAVIPDAGHIAPLEQPIATNRVLSEFLASLP